MKKNFNADDLGISKGVNKAIIEASQRGCLTHTSALVNAKYVEDAIREVNRLCPQLQIGLHVNLTCGKPISNINSVDILVGKDGKFKHTFLSLLFSNKSQKFIKQICVEITAQITKAVNFGRERKGT